ncbi:MAG TPA: SDR family NAD(P)-dependent oxidoreductase [Caulobacteraceae bacterium]
MKELAGKTAVVTGAASGIGLGIATALARAGVKVMLCDIEQGALDTALAQLRQTNAQVEGVKADVSLKSELQAAAQATLDAFGEAHILVSNAGVGGGGSYGTWTDTAWSWTIGVNLMAVVWGAEIFGPLIESAGGGHIVNTASMAGLISGSANAYNATKYGVVALSEGLRVELAPRGIGVSVLCPGFIHTKIADYARNKPARFAGESDVAASRTAAPQLAAWIEQIRARIEGGIDPLYVGELVREGIENDWPYIFTDAEFEPFFDARVAAIKAGFDQIRDRTPKRG